MLSKQLAKSGGPRLLVVEARLERWVGMSRMQAGLDEALSLIAVIASSATKSFKKWAEHKKLLQL